MLSRNLHRPPSLHSSWHLCYRSPLTCPASLPPSFPRSPLHGRPATAAASVPAPKPSFAHNPQGGRDRASPLSHAQWKDGAACVCLRPALSTWVWHLMPLHRPIAVRLCRVTRIDRLICTSKKLSCMTSRRRLQIVPFISCDWRTRTTNDPGDTWNPSFEGMGDTRILPDTKTMPGRKLFARSLAYLSSYR